MRAGGRTILRAGDLEDVLAGLRVGHAELLDRGPMLDPRDGGAGCELMDRRPAGEVDRYRDVAAAMQVQLGARRPADLTDDDEFAERFLRVFGEKHGVGIAAVLLDEHRLDDGGGVVGIDLDVLDFADAVPLVEDVDQFHSGFSRERALGRDAPDRPLPL